MKSKWRSSNWHNKLENPETQVPFKRVINLKKKKKSWFASQNPGKAQKRKVLGSLEGIGWKAQTNEESIQGVRAHDALACPVQPGNCSFMILGGGILSCEDAEWGMI